MRETAFVEALHDIVVQRFSFQASSFAIGDALRLNVTVVLCFGPGVSRAHACDLDQDDCGEGQT
jgi:hypothetical protein